MALWSHARQPAPLTSTSFYPWRDLIYELTGESLISSQASVGQSRGANI